MSKLIDFSNELSKSETQYVAERPWLAEDAALGGLGTWADGVWTPAEDELEEDLEDEESYDSWSVKDLKAEIEERNAAREDDAKIVAEAPGNKPELIAALEADDNASEDDGEE